MNQAVQTSTTSAGFSALGLSPELAATLTGLGYEEPTPIQREAIPPLLAGRDVLGQAGTGTGKTAAFALPLLERLGRGQAPSGRPSALVLVPTRELAMQVAEAIHRYGREHKTSVLPIYGGQSMGQQLRALERGVQVVVATPGRALDHLQRQTLNLELIQSVVLDEADEMLDMGFIEDLEKILSQTPSTRQTALFSATLPPRIQRLAEGYLKDPVRIAIANARTQEGEVPRVRQLAYIVSRAQKPQALGRVLDMEAPTSAIVFCRTRVEVDDLTEAMNAHGYRAEALHGGFAQEQRDRVIKRLRSEKLDLLIATDVAARGLDIEHLSHVVNYDVPSDPDAYVHRIGRTGRAGREGVAITLLEPRENRLLRAIEKATRQKITIGTIPTAADLRQKRLERTRDTLRETLQAGELDAYRSVVADLAGEYTPLDVAAAAVKLVHESGREDSAGKAKDEDQDLAVVTLPRPESPASFARHDRPGRFDRSSTRFGGPPRNDFGERPFGREGREGRGRSRNRNEDAARLFIGAGSVDGLRPGDLVGAIANEAGLSGNEIGPIQILERFSLVDVPADRALDVIAALRNTSIRGRRVNVRRDKHG